jgi:hypothetical protein
MSRRLAFRIADMMGDPRLLGPYFDGPSWDRWRAVLKSTFGEPLTAVELAYFREVAGGRDPPGHRVSEAVFAVGRGGGKDSAASKIRCSFSPAQLQRGSCRRPRGGNVQQRCHRQASSLRRIAPSPMTREMQRSAVRGEGLIRGRDDGCGGAIAHGF